MFKVPENCRLTEGHPRATRPYEGKWGLFIIPGPCDKHLICVASDGSDWTASGLPGKPWEHVSVSVRGANRCPNWPEMHFIKQVFWDDEDCVMQLHPPKSDYVNCHPFVLHLWRPIEEAIPRPPSITVGPKQEVNQ